MERWEACIFDTRYKISDCGNIKRVLSNGNEKLLKPSILNKGRTHEYKYFQTSREGKRFNHLIHRLVAFAFCDGHSEENNICDHIDRNTYNNHYTNLRWGTQKNNMNNTVTNVHTGLTGKEHKNKLGQNWVNKKKESKEYYCENCKWSFSTLLQKKTEDLFVMKLIILVLMNI